MRRLIIGIVKSAAGGCAVTLLILFVMKYLEGMGFDVNIRIGYFDVVKLWLLYVVLGVVIILVFMRSK